MSDTYELNKAKRQFTKARYTIATIDHGISEDQPDVTRVLGYGPKGVKPLADGLAFTSFDAFALYYAMDAPAEREAQTIEGVDEVGQISPIPSHQADFILFERNMRSQGWSSFHRRTIYFLPTRLPAGTWWVFYASEGTVLPRNIELHAAQ